MSQAQVTLKAAEMSPTAQAVQKANEEFVITDERGRKITLKKPGVLAQFRLIEALGGEAAANQTYVNMVLPLLYVAQIDENVIHQPTSKLQVEALIQNLDEEGISAVHRNVFEKFGKRDLDAEKATIKK